MSSSKVKEVSSQPNEVVKFFSEKSVFITGAAGFLGVVLLEILLRCCTDIRRIYILLRPKKGVLPEDRAKSIFKREIFSYLREKNPDVFGKVIVVSGDIAEENLGMSDEDLHTAVQEVSIVFHCAAAITFMKSLRFMVQNNVIATMNVIEFCRKLKKLEVVIHTSTAYSNCNRPKIHEKIYELPFPVDEFLDHYRNNRDAELMHLFSTCSPKFPNFYVFSKCLAEKCLQEKASDLPVVIVRPSIIVCVWKGVLPGYVEKGSALVNLSVGIGKGFIRVLHLDTSIAVDTVPVDFVANTLIVVAWAQATQRLASPTVYNCVSGPFTLITWKDVIDELFRMVLTNPLPNSYQTPCFMCHKNLVLYWLHSIIEHYAPSVVIDTLLWLSGRKPRLFKLYRFFDNTMHAILPFLRTNWEFTNENYKNLCRNVNITNAKMFPLDMHDFSPSEIAKVLPKGAPFYQWKTDKKPYKERMRATYVNYLLTRFIKWLLLGTVGLSLYMIIF